MLTISFSALLASSEFLNSVFLTQDFYETVTRKRNVFHYILQLKISFQIIPKTPDTIIQTFHNRESDQNVSLHAKETEGGKNQKETKNE